MIQMLMYCWNLRKLCKLLDDRRAASHVCQRFTDLHLPQNLSDSEDLSDHELDDEGDDEAESEQECLERESTESEDSEVIST